MASSMMGQEFKRVKEDKLDKKLTAENIIGKDVVDSSGQKVGKVKDIGLESAMHGSSRDYASSTQGSDYASTTAGSSTSSRSATSTSSSSTPSSTTTPSSTGAGAMTGRPSGMSGMMPQVNLLVELDRDVGLEGDDLASIPVSAVQYDSEKEELKLQISRSELKSKLQGSSSSSNN